MDNNLENVRFPQYRKYKNNKHFFKIVSATEFEEISFIGKKLILTKHLVKILPDRNMLYDLLFDLKLTADEITQKEFEDVLKLK